MTGLMRSLVRCLQPAPRPSCGEWLTVCHDHSPSLTLLPCSMSLSHPSLNSPKQGELRVFTRTEEMGEVDWVLLALKSYSLKDAPQLVRF